MALIDITPVMTSNTTPSPYVVSSSGDYTANFAPWKAFNGTNNNEQYDCWMSSSTTSSWIMFNFGEKTRIEGVSILNRNTTLTSSARPPKDFTIQGSDDGINFNDIKAITGVTSWVNAEEKTYVFSSVSFQYYRVYISANTGSSFTNIGEIKFWQDDTVGVNITNKKASLNYCLPKNSTLAINQRNNDPREGLLGFANDPDDRYGTLYMIDNKGKAIIPKALLAKPDILFDGLININSSYSLLYNIYNYSYLLLTGYGSYSNKGYNAMIFPVEKIILNTELCFVGNVNNGRSIWFKFIDNKTILPTVIDNFYIDQIYGIK